MKYTYIYLYTKLVKVQNYNISKAYNRIKLLTMYSCDISIKYAPS